jgi:hypothetical protein
VSAAVLLAVVAQQQQQRRERVALRAACGLEPASTVLQVSVRSAQAWARLLLALQLLPQEPHHHGRVQQQRGMKQQQHPRRQHLCSQSWRLRWVCLPSAP